MKFERANVEIVKLNVSDIVATSGGMGCEDCPCFDPIGGGIISQ